MLLRSLWRRPEGGLGRTLRQPFRRGGDGPAAAARRALVTLGLSVAPNGYVLEIGDNQDDLSLHRLSPALPRPDPEWPL